MNDQDEHFRAFKQHVREVITQNDQADKEWVAEINQFALEVSLVFMRGIQPLLYLELALELFPSEI